MTARVNALWRELQKSASPRRALQQNQQNTAPTNKKADARKESVQKETAVVDAAGEDFVLSKPNLERMMQRLGEKKPDVQKRGLRCLKAYIQHPLLVDHTDRDRRLQAWMEDVAFGEVMCGEPVLLERLVRRLIVIIGDGSEPCKISSAEALQHLFAFCADGNAKGVLDTVVPVLYERMALRPKTMERVERSEDVRLLTVALIRTLIQSFSTDMVEHMDAVFAVLSTGCSDMYPRINISCCQGIQTLCDIYGKRLFRISKDLLAAVAPLAQRRQQRVRVAAIRAIGSLVECGAHEMILELVAFHHPNIIPIKEFYEHTVKVNFFGSLSQDTSAMVRKEFLELIGNWLLNLPERLDYVSRLLPYLLNSLTDDIPDVKERGLEILTEIGAQYERDHEIEICEKIQYLPEEAQGIERGTSENIWKRVGNDPALLAPFVARPRLGIRLTVQIHFGSFVSAICSDLCSHDEDTVIHSLQLLRVCLLLVEDDVDQHLKIIVDALVRTTVTHGLYDAQGSANGLTCLLKDVTFLLCSSVQSEHLATFLEGHLVDDASDRAMAVGFLFALHRSCIQLQ